MFVDGFTTFHVLLSFAGILSGLIVLYGMLTNERLGLITGIFLLTTLATSITGFMFPFSDLLPSHYVGIISIIVLIVAILARYAFHLIGTWRPIYVATALTALWLNVFVLIVQLFLKVEFLNNLAPNGNEPPFLIAQSVTLAAFALLGWRAAARFDRTA